MTKEQAAKAYLAAIAPATDALRGLQAKANAWTDSTPSSQAAADAKPTVDALTTLRSKLLALAAAYPAAAADLKAAVNAQAIVQADLANLGTVNTFNASSWVQQFVKDASATTAASAIVRSDLGLPPPPTS
jgi:hypothetical protein